MKPVILVLWAGIGAAALYGQTGLATITGTINDPAGAVVADAPVTVRNLENGQVFNAASSATGNFNVSQLPIGDYDMTITVPGFKTYTRSKFHLAASQIMRADVSLEVGQTSDSVTVTADSSMLKTESSELVHNVTLSQLDNLPIMPVGALNGGTNSGFRDPYNAIRLVPGVRYTSAGATISITVNGTPANTQQTRLDGQTQNATRPSLAGATMQTQPSVDAIQEVAVQTSNFAAEYGTAGGAMITMVSKSGTNQFHGSAYDYAANEALNAAQPYTGLLNVVRQHDWGFTFGGPFIIPKVYNGKNKTFFFYSYEQYRDRKLITNITNTTVPTQAYRDGDFKNLIAQENRLVATATGAYVDPLGRTIQSGTIFDPLTQSAAGVRDPFPGNVIPKVRYDPTSAKVLGLVPLPSGANADKGQAGSNYQVPYHLDRTSPIPSIKVDQVLGSKSRMSFYTHETTTNTPRSPTGVDALPDLVTGSITAGASATTARINYDYTASPRLLLHFGIGWNDDDFHTGNIVQDFDVFKELGLKGQTKAIGTFPTITTNVNANTGIGGMTALGGLGSGSLSFDRRVGSNISATYVRGGHTYKIGGEYRLEKYPDYARSGLSGSYTFGQTWTGQSSLQTVTTSSGFTGFQFASFLLGGVTSASVNAPTAASQAKSETSLFVQDNWKVTRKLTLDYGLRWDYGTYPREMYGRYSSFAPTLPNPSASGRLGARQYEATCKCNFANSYPYAIGPRLAAAYQINSKTVIRTGIAVVYNATTAAGGGAANGGSSGAAAAYQILGQFKDSVLSQSPTPVWPSFDPAFSIVPGAVGTGTAVPTYLDQNAGRPARMVQWNFTIQREINHNLVVEAAYVGNRGVWWETPTTSTLAPLNVLSEDALRSAGFKDFTSKADSDILNATISALTATQKATLAARGVGLPYANFPTSQKVNQSLLPFPQYVGAMNPAGAPLGKTWYDALQLTLTKRFSHGLSFNANYTYSKTLDLTSSPDVFNRQLGKDLSASDFPHVLRLIAQYQVPRIQSSLPVLSNKIVSYALMDWGLGVYASYQSAALVGLPSSTSTTPISQFLGRPAAPATMPAQQKIGPDGKPMNPWSVDWTDYDGTHHTDPLNINCHCFDPTTTQVLNPNAWVNVPDGQWGANLASIRSFRTYRTPTENFNVSRNFRIKEGINLNVRAEFINIFNRMRFPTSLTVPSGINLGNFATPSTKFTSGVFTGLYSGGFGTLVTPVNGAVTGMRAGSLVARITF